MVQSSRFWTTDGASPDAPVGGYSADQFSSFVKKVFGSGVLVGIGGELALSGTATPVQVQIGACLGAGYFYESTAVEDLPISSPTATTGFRVVVRFVWSVPEAELVISLASDGDPDPPALVQNDGTTWEVNLGTGTITGAGVIALDEATKEWCEYSTKIFEIEPDSIDTEDIVDLAVTTEKIGNTEVTAGKIDTVAVTEGKIGDGAVTENKIGVDAVTATKIEAGAVGASEIAPDAVGNSELANLAVATANIQDDAVDSDQIASAAVDRANLGSGAPRLGYRQGGSSGDWDDPGSTNRTLGTVEMQCGSIAYTIDSGEYSESVHVDFPQSYNDIPLVFTSVRVTQITNDQLCSSRLSDVTETGFNCSIERTDIDGNAFDTFGQYGYLFWLAIGPSI